MTLEEDVYQVCAKCGHTIDHNKEGFRLCLNHKTYFCLNCYCKEGGKWFDPEATKPPCHHFEVTCSEWWKRFIQDLRKEEVKEKNEK